MSPTRRDFFALLAGGAASLAVTPTISAAEPALSIHDELIVIRDAATRLCEREDADEVMGLLQRVITPLLDMQIMDRCPHDRSAWHCNKIDSMDPTKASFTCPECRASWTFPHIDGRYAGRR